MLSRDEGDLRAPREACCFSKSAGIQTRKNWTELRIALADILAEVASVVDDFPAMCERLHDAQNRHRRSECVPADYRDEAAAFLEWLEQDHMTLLGYEYLQVKRTGKSTRIKVDKEASLGLLRHRDSGA